MTPFEPHLWHLPCAFSGAIKQQSRHSKSVLGELEVLRFQDGHETIDLAGRENELLRSWISFSDESMACLPIPIFLVLCAAESGRQVQTRLQSRLPNADKAVNT